MKSIRYIPLLLLACTPQAPVPPGAKVTSEEKRELSGMSERLYKVEVAVSGIELENRTRVQQYASEAEARAAFEKAIPQRPKERGENPLWARSEYALWYVRKNELILVMFLPPEVMTWYDLSEQRRQQVEKAIRQYFAELIQKEGNAG